MRKDIFTYESQFQGGKEATSDQFWKDPPIICDELALPQSPFISRKFQKALVPLLSPSDVLVSSLMQA